MYWYLLGWVVLSDVLFAIWWIEDRDANPIDDFSNADVARR